jgi:(2R)-ethylmalonyl-CoA mutase
LRAIERGDIKIVGVNCYQETAESPLTAGLHSAFLKVDPDAEREQIERLRAFRAKRNAAEAEAALRGLADVARSTQNVMPACVRCAHAGVTTGEWGDALRRVFGEYRAPTGIDIATHVAGARERELALIDRVKKTGEAIGRPLKLLVGKPGLDGHSNGAEQIAVKARDAGFEVVYDGIRLTPEQIATAALEEGVHVVGLSVLSGSHLDLVRDVLTEMRARQLAATPVVVGGIIPAEDATRLRELGVRGVYTPKDADLNSIINDIVDVVRASHGLPALGSLS